MTKESVALEIEWYNRELEKVAGQFTEWVKELGHSISRQEEKTVEKTEETGGTYKTTQFELLLSVFYAGRSCSICCRAGRNVYHRNNIYTSDILKHTGRRLVLDNDSTYRRAEKFSKETVAQILERVQ